MPNSEELKLETIRLDWAAEGVAVATLDRPARMNAMTMGMFTELEELAWHLGNLDAARVLILTGAGKAFCAGYDLADAAELPGLSPMGMLARQEQAARALSAVRAIRIPVIAALNGAVAGGGLALALAADIRIASPAAKFNAAFVRIGLSAGDLGTSWLLPRLIGPALAAEIAYTGRFVEATEAERIGLVNRVVPTGTSLAAAQELAAALARFPQTCLREDRLSLLEQEGLSEPAALANELAHGRRSLRDVQAGLERFRAGAGRHGAFD